MERVAESQVVKETEEDVQTDIDIVGWIVDVLLLDSRVQEQPFE